MYGQPPPPPGEIVNILGDDDNAKQSAQDGSSATSFNKGHSSSSGGSGNTDLVNVTEAPHLFSLETLIITVSAGAVAALVVGFVTG